MGSIASQITSLTIVYSSVNSGADQRKHQSSASLAFVRGIHRRPVNSPHKGPVTRKLFPFDDVIMHCIWRIAKNCSILHLRFHLLYWSKSYGRAMDVLRELFGEMWPRDIGSLTMSGAKTSRLVAEWWRCLGLVDDNLITGMTRWRHDPYYLLLVLCKWKPTLIGGIYSQMAGNEVLCSFICCQLEKKRKIEQAVELTVIWDAIHCYEKGSTTTSLEILIKPYSLKLKTNLAKGAENNDTGLRPHLTDHAPYWNIVYPYPMSIYTPSWSNCIHKPAQLNSTKAAVHEKLWLLVKLSDRNVIKPIS